MLLKALSCTKETSIISKLLNISFVKDSGVRRGDVPELFSNIGKNFVGRDLAFDFVSNKWDIVFSTYGTQAGVHGLSKIMESMLNDRNTQSALDKITTFQEKNGETLGSSQRTIKQAIEKTQGNIEWMENHFETISAWLSEQKNDNDC